MADKLYMTSQAAKAAGISKQTLYTWVAEGKVKMPKMIGNARIWTESEVAQLKRVPRPKPGRKPKRKI